MTGSDPQGVQFQLDRAATSPTRGCGEGRAVVGQQRGWEPIGCGGLVEAGDHVGGLGGHPGVGGDQQAGVVIEDIEDADLGGVGQGPVGEVGLPALVRQISFEPDIGTLGTLVRLGVTNPRRTRIRQIVAGEGAWPCRCWRWKAMV